MKWNDIFGHVEVKLEKYIREKIDRKKVKGSPFKKGKIDKEKPKRKFLTGRKVIE
jgi:hypothetical protein